MALQDELTKLRNAAAAILQDPAIDDAKRYRVFAGIASRATEIKNGIAAKARFEQTTAETFTTRITRSVQGLGVAPADEE